MPRYLVDRVGPQGYTPSGEPQPMSPAEKLASMRGMLPAGVLELLQMIFGTAPAQGMGQMSDREREALKAISGARHPGMPPARPRPTGMLPLPAAPRG